MSNDLVLVSNWELVDKDDFYLSDDWFKEGNEESVKEARKLQKEDNLYLAYIVEAKSYVIYRQMDSSQVLINGDSDIVLHCESAVIENNHQHREEYEY